MCCAVLVLPREAEGELRGPPMLCRAMRSSTPSASSGAMLRSMAAAEAEKEEAPRDRTPPLPKEEEGNEAEAIDSLPRNVFQLVLQPPEGGVSMANAPATPALPEPLRKSCSVRWYRWGEVWELRTEGAEPEEGVASMAGPPGVAPMA